MTPDAGHPKLPTAAAGLLAVCCSVHLILLVAGVGAVAAAVAAAVAGAGIAATGILVIGGGAWWTARHRNREASVVNECVDDLMMLARRERRS